MIRRLSTTLASLAMVGLLAACASPVKLDEAAPVETRTPTPAASAAGTGPGAAAGGAGQSGVATVDLARNAAAAPAAPADRIVYFDFDSFEIKDQYKGMLEGHARALAAQRSKRMVVEGHTDERGGREYNLALGQKRAEAVVRALELLGVGANQLEAVSFGEERPVALGHDEESWAKNRRAELKDR
jgi:peptidoglycan-associated lipoprotein